MARRNPLTETKKIYFKNLTIRKVHPWVFYHQCIKCGDEFCREPMYKCQEQSIFPPWFNYYKGCSHCFHNKEEFHEYFEEEGKILKEENFDSYYKKFEL